MFAPPWLVGCTERVADPVALPPTANRATYEEMWADVRAVRHPGDGEGELRWVVAPPDEVPVGAPVELALELVVGAHGIAVGGVVTFIPSPFWGWSSPEGRTTWVAPDGVVLTTRDAGGMLLATVSGRAITAGERVGIRYHGQVDRFAEARSMLWVAVDADGDGIRGTLPSPLAVRVVPGPPVQLHATVPSTAIPGATVLLRIAALDRAGNAPARSTARVALRSSPELDVPAEVALVDGVATVPLTVRGPGIAVVQATADGLGETISNPLVARADVMPILWADLQIHSALSDGTGEPADLYRYARDVAGLDVAAVTDHDHWGMRYLDADPSAQEAIARATDAAYQPGAFVSVHGFEWTSWDSGHRHVLWFDRARPWPSSLDPATDTPADLHAALAGQPALVIRHHPAGGPVAIDWSFPIDPVLEPVVEIASVHGQSESPSLPGVIYDAVPEAFVERRVAAGDRFGLIGSTDGHDGHPGLSQLAGGYGGLAALEGARATRESVLDTLRARRVYATNGPRIVLRFQIDDTPMGGHHAAGTAEATVRVIGTAPIDHVELVHSRAGVVASRRGDDGALLLATFPVEGAPGDAIYVRVVQADGGLAWSSPIFFDG